jgi:hypothetical protein
MYNAVNANPNTWRGLGADSSTHTLITAILINDFIPFAPLSSKWPLSKMFSVSTPHAFLIFLI